MKNRKRVVGFSKYWIDMDGILFNEKRELNPVITKKGYKRTILVNDDGVRTAVFIHSLVAITFLKNPYQLPQVNHIDGDKLNNSVSNLEWCTPRQNQLHAYRIGLKKQYVGEKHGRAKLTQKQVDEIRTEYAKGNCSLLSIGRRFNVGKSTIGYIVNFDTWKVDG